MEAESINNMVSNLPVGRSITEHKFSKCRISFRVSETACWDKKFNDGYVEVETSSNGMDTLFVRVPFDRYAAGDGVHICSGIDIPLSCVESLVFDM